MNLVAPFGFYGWGNIGDESTLQGFARLLDQSGMRVNVVVGSRNPAHTSRIEPAFKYFNASTRDPRRWWALLWASAHAVVGGTPIMDIEGEWPLRELAPIVRSADRRRVPMAFIGVGTEALQREKSRRIVSETIAPGVRHWSVRCDRDRQRLVEYGVVPSSITVAADMAWLIEPANSGFGRNRLKECGIDLRRPIIGVNLVNENAVLDRNPEMVRALAQGLDRMVELFEGQVVFLANEIRDGSNFDKAAAMQVIARMRRSKSAVIVANEYFAPQQMMSIISCCSLTLSMRYHFCLFSALQKVPFIAIERSCKLSDLCWDTQWPATVVPPKLDTSEIIEHGTRLLQDADTAEERLRHICQRMRERASLNRISLSMLA